MGVVMCDRCDSYIDLDWHVEDVIYINDKAICIDCATEEEVDKWEADNAETIQRRLHSRTGQEDSRVRVWEGGWDEVERK